MTSESATTHETITPATAIIPSTPSTNMNQSQLNKELPAKPILREAESPEKRGIYDATDANAHLIPFPPLTPRPREDLSRLDSDDEIEIFHDSTATSPIQADDDAQRSKKFDCGPTVRYSLDARQVIMGELREPESSKPLGSQRDGYNTPKAEDVRNFPNKDHETKAGRRKKNPWSERQRLRTRTQIYPPPTYIIPTRLRSENADPVSGIRISACKANCF
ncbi:hypothetical protein M7I_7602 [Glarea lozoyensis 74030]|uniref:Uncharacterized protein n=1 Tax=Glarea lozoyensis (strain ATCC 74030 / MF5533) TaxID=1104152 RepID=H0EXR3_GLAL7|nr:hypothetical protein M7I_7602 [Glarea lozoyensis 74030]